MEFLFLVGIAFMAVLVFTVVGYDKLKEINDEKEFVLVKDLAFKVQNEINLAANVDDGYRRYFEIPQKLDYIDYDVTISNNVLIVESKNQEYLLFIPRVSGNITKGDNVICKSNGLIGINKCPISLNVTVIETCTDNIKNQDETDIDCGGVCGATCLDGQKCNDNGDCLSGNCNTSAIPSICYTHGEEDTTPPIISNVRNGTVTNETAVILWSTDEDSTSAVYYGTSLSLSNEESDITLTTSHVINLIGLINNTLYYYKVGSCDSSSNCANSTIYSFTTAQNIIYEETYYYVGSIDDEFIITGLAFSGSWKNTTEYDNIKREIDEEDTAVQDVKYFGACSGAPDSCDSIPSSYTTNEATYRDYALASAFDLTETGTPNKIGFYIGSAGTSGDEEKYAIYDDNGVDNGPGTLLCEADSSVYVNSVGWKEANITGCGELSAGKYWLAYIAEDDDAKHLTDNGISSAYRLRYDYGPSFSSGFPSTFDIDGITNEREAARVTYSTTTTNYMLNVSYTVNNISVGYSNYILNITASSSGEAFDVYADETKIGDITGNKNINYDVSPMITDNSINITFIDTEKDPDTTQDRLGVDLIEIHAWS